MTGIPGYTEIELPPAPNPDWSEADWAREFEETRGWLQEFLTARDPYVVLARSAMHLLVVPSGEGVLPDDGVVKPPMLEQAGLELAQALALQSAAVRMGVPTAPRSFERFWPKLSLNISAFIRKHEAPTGDDDVQGQVSHRARIQTVHYRNLFRRDDCEKVVLAILRETDAVSERELGYRLSDLYSAMLRVIDITESRLQSYGDWLRKILTGSPTRSDVEEAIAFFCGRYPLAHRAWRNRGAMIEDLKMLRDAAFQLSELGYPWVFTLTREELEREFSPPIVEALYKLAIAPGELAAHNADYFYLDNPIWKRPYIRLADGELFAPLARLALSFPFLIVEGVIDGRQPLQRVYEQARAEILEREIVDLLSTAMPSASVYRGVKWTDPADGRTYENDVVVTIGNFIFLFEAKSGRLRDSARRGGTLSLEKNFKELFVEPGLQAWRLQNYLDKHKEEARLTLEDGTRIPLWMERPKLVYKFSVVIEHFASLTSARYFLKKMNLIADDTAWAPVLSLGELQMVVRYLDSEPAFVHYLTRRSTIEDLIDFMGDEQDLVSLYLNCGFYIDATAAQGKRVVFMASDAPVRTGKVARVNRRELEFYGVELSPMWKRIAKEIYRDEKDPHRFDKLGVIYNQLPPALADIERRITRWRNGAPHKGEDTMVTKYDIGQRRFVLSVHLMRSMPEADEWRAIAHNITHSFILAPGVTDSLVLMMLRRSKDRTYDGSTFLRLGLAKRPDGEETIEATA